MNWWTPAGGIPLAHSYVALVKRTFLNVQPCAVLKIENYRVMELL